MTPKVIRKKGDGCWRCKHPIKKGAPCVRVDQKGVSEYLPGGVSWWHADCFKIILDCEAAGLPTEQTSMEDFLQ